MARVKDPTVSIAVVKEMKKNCLSLREAAKSLVANNLANDIQTVMQHHAIRKLPINSQTVSTFERYVDDGRIVDLLIEVHPDSKDRIEKELNPLFN